MRKEVLLKVNEHRNILHEIRMLYAFFWVIPRRLNFIYRRFGTLCSIFIGRWVRVVWNHEIRKRKTNWIGHNLRRNCLLKQVIEWKMKGEMDVTRRRGSRRRKLLDDLKDRRGYSHLKEEALDRTMLWNRFGGGFEPVVRQNTEWMIPSRIEILRNVVWFPAEANPNVQTNFGVDLATY